jgi:hypothetical protein
MRSNLHDLECIVHHETEKAWLVSTDGVRDNAVWLPKSACEVQPVAGADARHFGRGRKAILTAPEQLLIDKGLV